MPIDILHANDRTGHYPTSWYAATAGEPPSVNSLAGSVEADVCIVGGGYTGLSAALHLRNAGQEVVLIEAHRIGWGASGRNGGQASSGQRPDQEKLEKMLGHAKAKAMWQLAEEAKALVRSLIVDHAINCEPVNGIVYADHKADYVAGTRDYVRKLTEEYGYGHVRFLDRDAMQAAVASPGYHGGFIDNDAFHLHPLKYAFGLARAAITAGARLIERSQATAITREGGGFIVRTANGEVRAKSVLLACNGYLGSLEPRVARRVMPINNFIIATEPLGEARARQLIADNAAVADSRFVINYFRMSSDHRLLFGGGETYGYRFPEDIKSFVRRPMSVVFPQLKDIGIDYGWGGTLAITPKRIPAFLSPEPGLFSASGFSGHGITIATLAGKLSAEAIGGNTQRFDLYRSVRQPEFPGGTLLRWPLLVLAMTWFSLRDRM